MKELEMAVLRAITSVFVLFASAHVSLGMGNCPVKLPCYCSEKTQVENSKALTVVDVMCSQRGLTSIPKTEWRSLPTNVRVHEVVFSTNLIQNFSNDLFTVLQPRVIDLSGNNLKAVTIDDFTTFEKHIEELYLSHNHIMRFPVAVIADLKALKVLDISDTLTTNLKEFPKSTSLEKLILQSNSLNELDASLFAHLINLKELDLSDNRLNEIPSAIRQCGNLEICDLSDNYIEKLPNNLFMSTPKLKWLSLTNNQLHFNMFKAQTFRGLENSLEELYMSDIYIDRIPKVSFEILKKLEYVQICNTDIKIVSENDFMGLDSLEELVLCEHDRGIQLKTRAFKGVENTLKMLSLKSNNLKAVPKEALNILSELTELDLSRNNLSMLSSSDFMGLSSLRVLKLDYNEQIIIHVDAFKYVGATLRELYLRNIKLTSPPAALSMLKVLQKLDISNNNIQKVHENFFRGVSAWNVVMAGCKITHVLPRAFRKLYAKKKLSIDLSRNKISKLTFLTTAAIFEKVNVRSNPIDCGCHELAVSMCPAVKIVGRCSLPPSVAGESLGSDRFTKEMLILCNSTVANHNMHCPKTVTSLNDGADTEYHSNITGSAYRPSFSIVAVTVLFTTFV